MRKMFSVFRVVGLQEGWASLRLKLLYLRPGPLTPGKTPPLPILRPARKMISIVHVVVFPPVLAPLRMGSGCTRASDRETQTAPGNGSLCCSSWREPRG